MVFIFSKTFSFRFFLGSHLLRVQLCPCPFFISRFFRFLSIFYLYFFLESHYLGVPLCLSFFLISRLCATTKVDFAAFHLILPRIRLSAETLTQSNWRFVTFNDLTWHKSASNKKKIPSEMEVAPRYKLMTLLTLLALMTLLTWYSLSTRFPLLLPVEGRKMNMRFLLCS